MEYSEAGTNWPSICLPFIVANHYSVQTIGSQTSHKNNGKQQRLLEYKILVFQFCSLMIFSFVITLVKFTQLLGASLLSTQNGLPTKMSWEVISHNMQFCASCFHPFLPSTHREGWMSEERALQTLDNEHEFKSCF